MVCVCMQVHFKTKFCTATEDSTEGLRFVFYVLFQVYTVVSFKITAFWDVTPCILVDG